ncbi:MAG: hypothetical protein GQ534_02130, partial [Candidatus Delongbacteria bacterium]|nr:hypothetical protein [Candidatus Delongbacteria bacterium]
DESSVHDKLGKKYTPSLYVERNGLGESFNLFLEQSEKNVFAIVGASGCGKTNSILHLFNNLNDNPALFYSGTLLGNSFFEELQFDFNLEFSQQETELTIIKKISSLAEQHNKQFIFFIDAIDEWIATDKSNQLDKIIKIAWRYNIRLCISCKDLLWPSLLKNKDVSTNLSEHLYNVFSIEDFNENEFNAALINYSSVLNVPITTGQFSRDMYNPFSLRIAFEVSHSNKNISLNDNSLNSISLYLDQKLVKSSDDELCKRYLYSIAEVLLDNNTIHEDELKIREFLHLNINDEIPIDLFSNSLLYRNNIDNQNYIGFYFSKIRDYIISNEILLLSNKNQEQRIETITKSLDSFIGENAVNFYLGNCNSEYLTDTINALIIFDKKNNTTLTIKLIAQQNENLFAKVENEQIELIFYRIKELIKSNTTDYLNHEEINVVLDKLFKFSNIESHLFDLLYLINEYSCNYNVYNICKLLEKYDSVEGTNKLVKLVQDKNIETEIRRFALDSLNERNINREQVFLSLLNEYIEDKSGPLFYAKYWYHYVESNELRDFILDKFDTKPCELLVEILSHSKIYNTGELLFSRFLKNKYSDNTTWWLCRTICSLNYKPAIQKFVEIINENQESELSGHLLIGLGEMKAQELKPILYDIIESLPENYRNEIWLSHAFTGIMDDGDYFKLLELANKSQNIPTILFAAVTLSNRKNTSFNEFILKCVVNKNFSENKRYRIFQEWSGNLACDESVNGVKIIKNIESSNNILTFPELEQIYSIFEGNTELSTIALSILLNFENNIDVLENTIISTLPNLQYPIITRRVTFINITNFKELKVRLNNWLKLNLQLSKWDNKIFLFNCLQFTGMLGDFNHVEVIENNKMNIYNCFPSIIDDEKINKERYLNHILHTIRVSDNTIRTHLNL